MLTMTRSAQARRPLSSAPIVRGPLQLLDATVHGLELERALLGGMKCVADAKRGLPHPAHHIKDVFRTDRVPSLANIGRALVLLSQHDASAFRRHVVRPVASWLHALTPSEPRCLTTLWMEGERMQATADDAQRMAALHTNDPTVLDRAIDATTAELFATRSYLSALLDTRRGLQTVRRVTVTRGGAA